MPQRPNLIKREKVENARIKYQAAISKNISESEILWYRFTAFLTFNTILVGILGFLSKDGSFPGFFPFLPPLFGLIVSFLWYSLTERGFRWMSYFAVSARKIEEKYLLDECAELNPLTKGNEYRNDIKSLLNSENSAKILIRLFELSYLLILLWQVKVKFFPQ